MEDRGGDPKRIGKRQPLDFLLWKGLPSPKATPQWESVVGPGRPGWHIECTVMSQVLLGTTFDIHGGGTDLIFPHHESEIAQSYGLGHENPAKLWVHVSPLQYAGEKMSKSLGNLVFAKDLLKTNTATTIRLALMHYHHRIGGEWQPELLHEGRRIHEGLLEAAQSTSLACAKQFQAEVRAALDDDLNTVEVINAMYRYIYASKEKVKTPPDALRIIESVFDLLGVASYGK